MKHFILLLLILRTADAKPEMIYRFGNMSMLFHSVEGIVVNRSCEASTCLALEQAKRHQEAELSADLLLGGKNPSAVRCKELMGGKVLIGVDMEGNEQSFCVFKDGSYLM